MPHYTQFMCYKYVTFELYRVRKKYLSFEGFGEISRNEVCLGSKLEKCEFSGALFNSRITGLSMVTIFGQCFYC